MRKLREALEPRAETVDEIPPFDLALAHELYAALLEPVAAGWRSRQEPDRGDQRRARPAAACAAADGARLAASCHPSCCSTATAQVAWLARTHAVSQVPSAAALRTLRALPPGSTKREKLIGFGDPYFSTEQAAQGQGRGGGPGAGGGLRAASR